MALVNKNDRQITKKSFFIRICKAMKATFSRTHDKPGFSITSTWLNWLDLKDA